MSTRYSTKERREAARARAAAAREVARRAERRRRLRTTVVIVLLALTVGAGIAIQAARSASDRPAVDPDGRTADGFGVPLGSESAPVTVEVYEDFLCPACGLFEAAAGPYLQTQAAEGQIRVVYRPIAILDGYSTTRYSTRALNAAACAADAGVFHQLHPLLFEFQPPEGGAGLSDSRLQALGKEAGAVDGSFGDCVRDLRYERWAQRATEAASKAGVVRTPTVLVNGEVLARNSVADLQEAITRAAR